MKKSFLFLTVLTAIFLTYLSQSLAQQSSEIEIIFDASRSMLESAGGTTKFDAAKQAMTLVANQITPGTRVGLRAYGTQQVKGDVRESCKDSLLLIRIGPFQKNQMTSQVMALQANGMTPIGYSLQLAANDFTPGNQTKKSIILITDGAESCDVDPLGVIQALKAQGIDITIHTIGFGVDAKASGELKKISDMTGGTYADAKDAGQLSTALTQVAQKAELLAPQKGGGENILSAGAGTTIVSSSVAEFAQLIDGKEDKLGALYSGQEVVFAFKQPVLLEKFSVPIFAQDGYNPKIINLYGSTDDPNGGFFPIRTVEVQNKVFFGDVYQGFPMDPPVAVRYLKVVLGETQNGSSNSYHTEWAAYGKYLTDDEFRKYIKEAGKREFNVLSVLNGGKMIAATDTRMGALIDGTLKDAGNYAEINKDAEGIYGFKDGKKAVISKVTTPIFAADSLNPKKIEISVSETSPTSGYAVAGTFEPMNLAFAENPYQEYVLPKPVKAKFLKVKILSFQDEARTWGRVHELQAYGTLED